MLQTFHPLAAGSPCPAKFTNPFNYEPHPLCLAAAREVQSYIASSGTLRCDADRGKMFGVLVAAAADGSLGYFAAYSGLLAGRNDHAFFVPPVFDAMRPDGYFMTREAEIAAVTEQINSLRQSDGYAAARRLKALCEADNARIEADFRQKMKEAKARRDLRRRSGEPIEPDEEAAMTRESQFMKAELRRVRQRGAARLSEAGVEADRQEAAIEQLSARRKQMSDALQRWLFSRYVMLNARGETRDLLSIFADTPAATPPAGAGDCCAPKLLQHAYANGYRPVCMAEFWWGASPKNEVRHHLRFYPACRGKCLPILTHMLQGLDVDSGLPYGGVSSPIEIVYEDSRLAVVNKPAGLMSVPGRGGDDSLYDAMLRRKGGSDEVWLAHRLDMDTSGLLLVAYDADTYKALQSQFAARTVKKRYVALLDGEVKASREGTISLPLAADAMDRPYQKVDHTCGKTAVTRYRVVSSDEVTTRVELFPLTGRTHQLRVHCAHAEGLGTPIVGDRLYGHPAARLCLHAEMIKFVHPATGRVMTFERKAEF